MAPDQGRTVEQRLRAAVESAPSGLLMVDATGTIVLVNAEVERLLGYSREELLGRPVEMLVPERFREHHPTFRKGFHHDPRVRSMGAGRDLFARRRDGTEVPVEIGLTPVVTDEGLFVISSIVDITARQRAEARFRAAVESSPNGMVMTDIDGRIVLVNREAERVFGYARDELLGRPIDLLVPERFRVRHPEFRTAFFSDPQTRAMGAGRELFGLRKDGTEVAVEIGLNPIETDEGTFVLSSILDISTRRRAETERLELEAQLRQAQKMEAIGRLAGGVAHDFNNILGAIIGYAELAQEAAAGPQAAADIAELLRAATRGRELVERILRFSRRQDVDLRPINLLPAVEEASRLLRATIPAGIEIRLRLESETPRVLADATSVHQVLMNLATNAAHAMPSGGVLEIGAEPFFARDSFVRLHPGLREGLYALLTIRDTGIGMDEVTRTRAFEPFFTTKAPGSGSGLGLAMVHGIVQSHGGMAWIESEVSRGTVVRCLFPAAEAGMDEEAPTVPRAPQGAGQRILYVDDEVALATLGERRLTRAGYRVTALSDALAAVEAFRSAPADFDLVVTDYSMPRMGGLEVATELTRLRPGIPILMLTGYMDDLPEEKVRAAGVRRIIKKPVTGPVLAQAVYGLLHEL